MKKILLLATLALALLTACGNGKTDKTPVTVDTITIEQPTTGDTIVADTTVDDETPIDDAALELAPPEDE